VLGVFGEGAEDAFAVMRRFGGEVPGNDVAHHLGAHGT
jgi:hypothetical protein